MSCAPVLFPVPLPRAKRPSPALLRLRLRRPTPLRGDGCPLSRRPRAPRYLILGCPRCSNSPRSPRGSSGPPLPGRGWGGRSAPWRSWIFQHKHRPPTPPPSHGPALPRVGVPHLWLRPAFCRFLSPQPRCRKRYRMQIAEFGVQRAGSSPDPCLTNPYSIWITRLSKVSPAPLPSPALRLSHTPF